MSNLWSKFVIREKKDDVVHSSAYGRAQNGGAIGTASAQGFDERIKIEQNRQVVRGYNDSRVAAQAYNARPRARTYEKPAGEVGGGSTVGGRGDAAGGTSVAGATGAATSGAARFGRGVGGAGARVAGAPSVGTKPSPRPTMPRNPGIRL